ncbi:carbohydrate esterase family 16 protein [Sphaerobolus stellatus SS14]|nr:carbohydrate esterase family 16 protein [Sphaerobolus stellatus SS14]
MSAIIQKSESWRGFSKLRYLVVFGDSYSEVVCPWTKDNPIPTAKYPLGVEFPGNPFNNDGPNWVGYLATTYNESLLLVLDCAISGVTSQALETEFNRFLIQHGKEGIEWNAENALFATWIGINDIGTEKSYKESFEQNFEHQSKLYALGARNFMFIDVPPIERCPGVHEFIETSMKPRYDTWNEDLRARVDEFAKSHPAATVLLYSSWSIFTQILNDPERFDFDKSDRKKAGGNIWIDHLHPTAKVHKIVAKDIAEFLSSSS